MALKLGSTGSALRVGSTTAKYARVGTTLSAVAPPLDIAGSAAAAYSLRKLSYAYTGPVVEVRRSSDDATADFTADEVEDGTLAAWVGAGNDGFVATWYDQSGNDRDATQATAGYQPKIVDNGSVVTEGGKPAIEFDGVDDHLVPVTNISSAVWDGDFSLFCVLALTDLTTFNYIYSGWGTRDLAVASFGSNRHRLVFYDGSSSQNTFTRPLSAGTQYQLSWARSKANGTASYTNFVQSETTAYTGNGVAKTDSDAIGARYLNDRAELSALMQELIIYPSDQSTNRTAIEGNAAWHYGLQNKLPYNHAEVKPQTLPTDTDVLAFAAASGAVSIPDLLKIEDLVDYLKAQSLWDYARFYPMKSAQNAGSGSTVYGLGGLTSNNMTLVNSPTWGSDGLTFDGSTQYGNVGDIWNGGNFFASIRASLLTFPLTNAQSHFLAYYNGADDEREFLAGFVVNTQGLATSEDGTSGLSWGIKATAENATAEELAYGYQADSDGSIFLYRNKVASATTAWFNTPRSSLTSHTGDVFFCGQNQGTAGLLVPINAKTSCLFVVEGTPSPITTTQRETITDLINAL